jgi:predicted nucleic acid-binding protein
VILVDTSAWVEYLRGTGSRAHRRVRELLESEERLASTEVVVMEVLAGARDDAHLEQLRRLLFGCELLPLSGLSDYEDAAALYRQIRRAGKTVRSLTDCLIAVVAIRAGAELVHADRDFDTIARHAPLRITVGQRPAP